MNGQRALLRKAICNVMRVWVLAMRVWVLAIRVWVLAMRVWVLALACAVRQ